MGHGICSLFPPFKATLRQARVFLFFVSSPTSRCVVAVSMVDEVAGESTAPWRHQEDLGGGGGDQVAFSFSQTSLFTIWLNLAKCRFPTSNPRQSIMSGCESVPDMMLSEIQRQLAGEIPIISIPGQSSCYSPLAFQRQLVKSCQARGKNKDSIYI